jgi:exodeoxyribonuclease VII small subunit
MSGKTEPTEPTFEQAMARLGQIVDKLEDGDLPLEESLTLFEEGVKLSKITQTKLDQAQHKVEQLLGIGEDGRAKVVPFATNADDE